MRVYRVEHKDTKRGPFVHEYRFVSVFTKAGVTKLPVMHAYHYDWRAKFLGYEHDYRVAVRTLVQLSEWFGHPDVIEKLEVHGFIVSVYKVRKILKKDNHQVMVEIPAGKRPVARFKLTEIVFDSAS